MTTAPMTWDESGGAMSREYEKAPKGHRRLWVICYRIDNRWQADGEWYMSRDAAESHARDTARQYWWRSKVVPIDVPVGVLPLPRYRGER